MGSIPSAEPFRYAKVDGLYQLRCGESVLADMSHVAVAFSVLSDGTTIKHKHGTTDSVLRWFQWAKGNYERMGLAWIADELCYIVSDKWEVEDLNRILTQEGFLATFLERVGIDPVTLKNPNVIDPKCPGDISGREVPALPV
jgi:hypothetical protein